MNAATILDQALLQLPDEQLADTVRKRGDDALAELVRDNAAVRRFVLLGLLDQIVAAGADKLKAKPKRAAPPAPPPEASSGDEKTLARIVAFVDDVGEAGTRTGEVKSALSLASDYATRTMLQQLAADGRIRVEGEGRGTRYYPTA